MDEITLMSYFNFDHTDLNQNRNGSLTEKQKVRIVSELNSIRKKKTLLAYFIFFLGFLGVIFAAGSWFVSDDLGLKIGFTIGFGVVWPVVYLFIGLIFLPPSKFTDLELASERGRVNIVRVESRNYDTNTTSSRYDLYIGPRRFVADHNVGSIMVQGDEYIVYYLKNSSKIVSAEFISKSG